MEYKRGHHYNGLFFSFEGGEGCGKSTQVRLFAEKLEKEGYLVKHIHDPGHTEIGQNIRAILLNPANENMALPTEMLLYEASRAQMIEENIEPSLKLGEIICSDRFFDSTSAYQGGGGGMNLEDIDNVNRIATKGIYPDLTFFLDVDVYTAISRTVPKFIPFPDSDKQEKVLDRIEQRKIEYHERVRSGYLEVVRRDPKRVKIVDGNGTREEVHERVMGHFNGYITSMNITDLARKENS